MKSILFAWAILLSLIPTAANAGFIEIGASGSYRKSNIDIDAYDESTSYTGTLAYYFDESTALEASYTDGRNKRVINQDQDNGHITQMFYQTLGLDFVLTAGAKGATFRPYIKAGANYIISKRLVDQYKQGGTFLSPDIHEDQPGLVPSGGLGFRIGLTESISLKLGVDGWTSRPLSKPPVTIDWFGRAGLSFLF